MTLLPDVTIICCDTLNYKKAVDAIHKTLEQVTPARTIFFTDIPYKSDQFEVIQIDTLKSTKDYSWWMLKELGKYEFKTSHILVIQHDGYVLDGKQWIDEFLKFSYIGAPWLERDGMNVGNGGFSLRSVELHKILAHDDFILPLTPEDSTICRIYRHYLEMKYKITFAPEDIADKFSYELRQPIQSTFGFHGRFHPPFKPYVVLRRKGALGDVVQLEPVMHWFHEHGYNVVLDSPCYPLFEFHYFPVISYEYFDKIIPHEIYDLDMSYEKTPAQLHLKSYYEACGIQDGILRNPKLTYAVTPATKLFHKYVVIHIDRRETTHRNVYGIEWDKVTEYLESKGYTVIQIGHGDHEEVGTWINTITQQMMMWLIAGCDLFIGVDSGPSNIAVALGRPTIIFFGSVNPAYLYADTKAFHILQSGCPFEKQHCWHDAPGERGTDCENPQQPPCCVHDTDRLINRIKMSL